MISQCLWLLCLVSFSFLQLKKMDITEQHRELVKSIRSCLGGWKKYTIAVDGRDGVGKSTLSRFLAWQLMIPTIEVDLLVEGQEDPYPYNSSVLKYLIDARHRNDRPVIVEGLFLLKRLKEIGVCADTIIYVEKHNWAGSYTWRKQFEEYEVEYSPKQAAHFVFASG